MKIAVIGTGYVGLVTGTIFSDLGNNVTCVDIDPKKINGLKRGAMPIYEPGLEEVIKRNYKAKRLLFTTDIEKPIQESEVIFIAVGTPQGEDGRADLQYVKAVATDIGKALKKIPKEKRKFKIIVNKSTVPVGTGDTVKNIISDYYTGPFEVVSNPEFLREGQAIHDCYSPDRVVVGVDNGGEKVKKIMREIYRPLKTQIMFTDLKSAEFIKYASNSFLAVSISFINSMANLCEKLGGNVEDVAEGMKLDKRIGKNAFLSAGLGYGGSCFPKDVQALIRIAEGGDYNFGILKESEEVNKEMKKASVVKMRKLLGSLKGKKIAIWGLAFKPKTDDLREAVSLVVIKSLLRSKAIVKAYDPVAMDNARKEYPKIQYAKDAFNAARGADGLIILTEWDEFKQVDLEKLKKLMKEPNVVDGRNIFDPEEMEELGFNYKSIGR